MFTHSSYDWLNPIGDSPSRDRRFCGVGNLKEDLQEFGFADPGGGTAAAVMDDPNVEDVGQEEFGDVADEGRDDRAGTQEIDYRKRYADTKTALETQKEKSERIERENAELRARLATGSPDSPWQSQRIAPNPYDTQVQEVRNRFNQSLSSLDPKDPNASKKYADTVLQTIDGLTEAKIQRFSDQKTQEVQLSQSWESQTKDALDQAGLPTTPDAIEKFRDRCFVLNARNPHWADQMPPSASFKHVADLLVKEGGIVSQDELQTIDKANREHDRGSKRIHGSGSRLGQNMGQSPNGRKTAKGTTPKFIEPRNFVQQIDDMKQSRFKRGDEAYRREHR